MVAIMDDDDDDGGDDEAIQYLMAFYCSLSHRALPDVV